MIPVRGRGRILASVLKPQIGRQSIEHHFRLAAWLFSESLWCLVVQLLHGMYCTDG